MVTGVRLSSHHDIATKSGELPAVISQKAVETTSDLPVSKSMFPSIATGKSKNSSKVT